MKKTIIILFTMAVCQLSFAQLKINNYGMVKINAQTQDWWSGLKVVVPTYNSCAYHLEYNGKDRSFFHASGYLWCERGGYFGSDISLKENITPIRGALQKVLSLNGVKYQFKERNIDEENPHNPEDFRLGVIAQDVEKILPEVVKNMHDGTKAVAYTDLIAVLIEAVKEQQIQIEQLQTIVYGGESKSALLNEDDTNETMTEVKAQLFQNAPNPFSVNTEIKFEIPQNTGSAGLIIHDMHGGEVKTYHIANKGFGCIVIQASELSAGMYMYTLLVDNTIVDTRKMILTK